MSSSLIFLLALAIRLSYLSALEVDHPIRADAAKYLALAANLAEHGAYTYGSSDRPTPQVNITPGYPCSWRRSTRSAATVALVIARRSLSSPRSAP
jgi:hypothetical protein